MTPPGSPRLAARIWTVTATAEMTSLNVLTYLTAYLDACGRNGGEPPAGPDLDAFLPGTLRPLTCTPGHSHRRPADTGTSGPAPPPAKRSCRITARPHNHKTSE